MKRAVLLMVLIHLVGLATLSSQAATISVAPGAVVVLDDGICSLREAILNAQTGGDASAGDCTAGEAGTDTIELALGSTYVLPDRDAYRPENEFNGLPEIRSPIAINGNGATIERQAALGTGCAGVGEKFRIFFVSSIGGSLTLNDVTLRNGCAQYTCPAPDEAQTCGAGGAIFNRGGLSLNLVTLEDNQALHSGGGIHNDGNMTVTRSTVQGNAVLAVEAGGGGIVNRGTMNVTESTISDNNAAGSGGGLDAGVTYPYDWYPTYYLGSATVTNSTVSGNVSGLDGAGIFTRSPTTNVSSSTVTNNSLTSGTAGGIFVAAGGTSLPGGLTLQNSIVAMQLSGLNCVNAGGSVAGSDNLDNDDTCAGAALQANPLLGPLQDNGGPTETHELLAGSPAIDTGNSASSIDQRGVPRPQGAADDIGAFETAVPMVNIVKLTNGTNNDTAPGQFVPVGSTVNFTYEVTPGNLPLTAVGVVDDNGTPGNSADDFSATFVGGDTNANGTLDPGETWTFTASRVATAGQHTNNATASATTTIVVPSSSVSDTDVDNHFGAAAGINVVKLTNGTDNDTAPGPFVPVGSTVTFTYVVTNPGNTPLSGVTVNDDSGTPGVPADDFAATFVGGDANANALLDVTETWTFTASRIATAGQYTNLATVTGTPPPGGGASVSDTNPDNHFGGAAAINVVKLTNGTDNDTAPGVLVPVGGTVTFTYVVTNTGNVPLSGVTVSDDAGTPGVLADDFNATFVGGDTDADGLLDLTETWTFTASRVATAGQYTNIATVTGTPPAGAGAPVTDTNPDNHFGATSGINVVKLTNGTDNDTAPGVFVAVGSTVNFTYVVTNTGNVPLSGVTVVDDAGTPGVPADDFSATFVGGDTNADGLLDVTESWTFTASRIATAGQYTNVATASGAPPQGAGAPVSDTNPDNHFGGTSGLNVVKLTNGTNNEAAPGVFVPVGSTVTFTYTVTNPGNTSLTGVTVVDDSGTAGSTADDFAATFVGGDGNANGQLDPGETWTFTASRIATAGQHTNVATATATPPLGGPVSHTNADNHFGSAAAINLVALTNGTNNDVPPGPSIPNGTAATLTFNVTNPGNVPLSGVVVTVDNGTAANLADDFNATFSGGDTNANGLLDPGETFTFTASVIAVEGQNTVLSVASGTPPTGGGPVVSDSDPENFTGIDPATIPAIDTALLLLLGAMVAAVALMKMRA